MVHTAPQKVVDFNNDSIEIYDWPDGSSQPIEIPPHRSGIAVHVRSNQRRSSLVTSPLTVGLDNTFLWKGLGRKLAIVPTGDYLIEVRDPLKRREFRESVASQFVSAQPGKLVDLEYVEANHLNTFGGHFSKKPAISIGFNPNLKYLYSPCTLP